jgi:hypothetical protein
MPPHIVAMCRDVWFWMGWRGGDTIAVVVVVVVVVEHRRYYYLMVMDDLIVVAAGENQLLMPWYIMLTLERMQNTYS